MKDLNPSKAAGIDSLSGKFLKDGALDLTRPISQFFNLSIKLNSFPSSCKIRKVKPLFIKALRPIPISLLPMLSKIIELLTVCDQTE